MNSELLWCCHAHLPEAPWIVLRRYSRPQRRTTLTRLDLEANLVSKHCRACCSHWVLSAVKFSGKRFPPTKRYGKPGVLDGATGFCKATRVRAGQQFWVTSPIVRLQLFCHCSADGRGQTVQFQLVETNASTLQRLFGLLATRKRGTKMHKAQSQMLQRQYKVINIMNCTLQRWSSQSSKKVTDPLKQASRIADIKLSCKLEPVDCDINSTGLFESSSRLQTALTAKSLKTPWNSL